MFSNTSATRPSKDVPITSMQKPIMFAHRPTSQLKGKPLSTLKVVEKISRMFTAEEQYRLYGRIEGPLAVELLNSQALVETMVEYAPCVREASGCFPKEDVLAEQIRGLQITAAKMRAGTANRAEVERIVEELIELREELDDRAEHGRDELRKVIAAVEEAS